MAGTSNLDTVSTRRRRIAELAKQSPHLRGLLAQRVPDGTLGVSSGSETVTRGAGCVSDARPDLWEARRVTAAPTRPHSSQIEQMGSPPIKLTR